MRALVIFESMFGNTEKIAEAIADGLSETMTVDTVEVGSADDSVDGVDLLVVGGPTHAFGMSRESTRKSAADRGAGTVASKAGGIRDWIATAHGDGTLFATFDTKADHPHLPGSAAHAARRQLRRRGFRPFAAATSFYVTDLEGPLAAGEVERARRWGQQLGLART
ncbi:flavodoxin family protein [Jiangella anatolica]|uniref:Flavodoxin n=1 Tax=Jiangella anatolica TaxID=2670374 RepID=A0A2W2CL54_9ACTN|nr:flavodoxin domain-containing protein [Jiangella anatolica]PZF86126.1 flavodoxin [Jiangella anatolica]